MRAYSKIYTTLLAIWLSSGYVHPTSIAESVYDYLVEARTIIFKDSRKADSLLTRIEAYANFLPDTLAANLHNTRGIYYAVKGENRLASRQFFLGLSRAGALSNQYAGILSNLSITLKQSGEREMALRLFRHSLEVYTQHQNFEGIATVLGEMASVHSQRREFFLSVRLLTAAIRIWNTDEVRYRQKRAVDLQKLGNTYLNLGNFEYALKLYKEAREAFRLLGNNYMEALTCIQEADALLGLNQPENALSSLEQSLGIMESFNNVDILAHGYRLRGITLHTLSDSNAEEAKNQLEKALSYSKLGSRIYLVSVLNSMLEFHKKRNQWDQMEPLIKEAQEAIQLGLANADDMRRFFELAMNFYQTKGLHEPALAFAQKTLAIKDSLRILEQNEKAIELQTKYKTEILEKENLLNAAKAESLSSKLKLRSRSVYLLSALLVFVTLATMFVIRSLKLKQELNQTKLQHALKTKERVEQQNKVLAENLILKEKLVQNQRLQLEQNAVEVMSLTAQLEVSQEPGSTNESSTSTNSNSNDANYWKNFMEQFKRVNPDFMESLEKACPGLSRSEKEFCVLIKLGMSYKEIANVLRISHSSAITKKYRICKKLSIASDTDFYTFIKSLD